MAQDPLFILVIVAVLIVAGIMLFGVGTFGKGGDSFLRFNIATPRARVEEACTRLKEAFKDLQ